MLYNEELFLMLYQELSEKLSRDSNYELIRSMAIIRQLLLDSKPLVHIVNERFKLKIEFEVADNNGDFIHKEDDLTTVMQWQDIYPYPQLPVKIKKVNLDGFLKTKCLRYLNHDYSVKDVVKSACHLKGGVHNDSPKNVKDIGFLNMDHLIIIGGKGITFSSLKEIGGVTIKGLYPLHEIVRQHSYS